MTEQNLPKISAWVMRQTPMTVTAGIVGVLLIVTVYAKYGAPFRSHTASSVMVLPDNARREREAELITIEPHGFEPVEITRPQGRFLLAVDNRSGLEDIQLHLERAEGGRVPALEARNRRLSWREEVDLPLGRYVIRETNHPEWSCRITITAR